MLHSLYHLRSVFYRFETYNHALPISLLRLKIRLSKKTPHRRLKRNLSWVFRWKSVDITHHARVRYTNCCLKIAKSCGKKRQQNATKSLENRRNIVCINWPELSWFAQYCRTTRVFKNYLEVFLLMSLSSPNISCQTLYTVLHTIPTIMLRRICPTIKMCNPK